MLIDSQDRGPGTMPSKASLQQTSLHVFLPTYSVSRNFWRQKDHDSICLSGGGALRATQAFALGAGFVGPSPRGFSGCRLGRAPEEFLSSSVGTYSEADDMQYQPAVENSAEACQCVSCKTKMSQTCLASVCSQDLISAHCC